LTSRTAIARATSLAALPVLLLLGACAAPIGDLGRRESGVFPDTMAQIAGPFAPIGRGERPALLQMTDDENELRRIGFDLVRPPDRHIPGDSISALRWWRALPDGWYGGYPAAYWSALMTLPVASHETRYERLAAQARFDSGRMPAFRDVSVRISHADGARRQAIQAVAADRDMTAEAERRIGENVAVVQTVCRALATRLAAYRYTLHRLMVETPSPRAVDVEAAVEALAWETNDCPNGSRRPRTPGIEVRTGDRFLPRTERPPQEEAAPIK